MSENDVNAANLMVVGEKVNFSRCRHKAQEGDCVVMHQIRMSEQGLEGACRARVTVEAKVNLLKA